MIQRLYSNTVIYALSVEQLVNINNGTCLGNYNLQVYCCQKEETICGVGPYLENIASLTV